LSLDRLIQRFVNLWFQLHPHLATEKGQAGFDHLTADYRAAKIDDFLLAIGELERELCQIDLQSLTAQERIDHQLLRSQLSAVQHPFRYRRVLSQNPVFYLQAGLDGLEALHHRYHERPWQSLEARLLGLTPLLEVAQAQLDDPRSPALEVSIEMAEDALQDLASTLTTPETPDPVKRAAQSAVTGLRAFHQWLSGKSRQEFVPMGPEAFASLLKTEYHLERHWSVWESMAEAALESVEEQLSKEPKASTDPNLAPSPQEIWQFYLGELERVKNFLAKSEIVTIPAGELLLCQTPAYLEALIPGPFYLEPALYSGARVGRFYMPSFPEPWTAEVAARYAKKRAYGGFTNLVVHEAWPGHHLQFLHAADRHHPLRNLRDNDVMLEGWALYCEELMEEIGLHEQTPFWPRLHSLKFRILRVILDIGIHTGKLSLAAAERLMQRSLPQASGNWISAEIRRYALEPGQALSYWVGAQLIRELKTELGIEREHYQQFHDALLSFGAIPLPLIGNSLRASHLGQ